MKTRILLVSVGLAALLFAACGGPTDAELKTKAEEALKGDPTTSSVNVEVKDGAATVSGEVKDDAAKAKAAELAKVEGVTSVTNDVVVAAAPPPMASADDATLKTKAEEALKAKNCGDITVAVSEGRVTLRGTISREKLPECIMAVQETKPKSVDNQLQVQN